MPLEFGIYANYGRVMVILSYRKHLISAVEGFLLRSGMKPTRFGLLAVKDAKFLKRLQRGQRVSIDNADRVLAFIAAEDARGSGDPNRTGAAA